MGQNATGQRRRPIGDGRSLIPAISESEGVRGVEEALS
jgi:hypothetical protein